MLCVVSGTSRLDGGSIAVVLSAPVRVVWQLRVQPPLSDSTLLQFWVSHLHLHASLTFYTRPYYYYYCYLWLSQV